MNKLDIELSKYLAELFNKSSMDAVVLSGSATTNSGDQFSDYDIYVYSKEEVDLEFRRSLAKKYCSYMELNNQFWETEDDGILNTGREIEFIFRNSEWIEHELKRIVFDCSAMVGYSTCLWHNVLSSTVIAEKDNWFSNLQEQFNIPYPKHLQVNIIKKNLPLLTDALPAYIHQIKKAKKRNDLISINHRIAAFLESYFDILFAVNGKTHPGEKQLIKKAKLYCKVVPPNFSAEIHSLLSFSETSLEDLEKILRSLSDNIQSCITNAKIL